MQNEKITPIETATELKSVTRCSESRREPQTGRRGRPEQAGERVAGESDFRDFLNAEIERQIKELEATCKKYGIDIMDENGNMRPMADICADMSAELKKLSG